MREHRVLRLSRLPAQQRWQAVAELSAEGMPQREIAKVLGVGKGTVIRDQAKSAPNGAIDTKAPSGEKRIPAPNGPKEQKPDDDDRRKVEIEAAKKLSFSFLSSALSPPLQKRLQFQTVFQVWSLAPPDPIIESLRWDAEELCQFLLCSKRSLIRPGSQLSHQVIGFFGSHFRNKPTGIKLFLKTEGNAP
jgi:hypothetical protein